MTILDTDASYHVTFRPNHALSARGKIKVVVLLAIIPCLVALGFSLVGAWWVTPFVGVEILALAYAFYYVSCHESDYESISISGDQLLLEFCVGGAVRQVVLNPYWVKLARHELASGDMQLSLLSHGKTIEIGKYLTSAQRVALAMQLEKRIGMFEKR